MVILEEYKGKRCFIQLERNGKQFYYTADVLEVTNTHISFKDKYGDLYSYQIRDIIKMNELKEEN